MVSACNLKPADVSGFSDPFVTIEWDGCEQISKVISSNLNPNWNETLYFPLKCALDRAVLEQKPCVSVRVYDLDESGSDLLGQCEVPLHKITSAVLAKIDEEVLPSGDCHKGRVLKLERQVLLLPDQHIESTIDLWLYFTPDLPLDIVLEDRSGKGHTGRSLDIDYEQRLRSWYEGLPEWVRRPIEEAQRLEVLMEQGMPPNLDRNAHPNRSRSRSPNPTPTPNPNPNPNPNPSPSPSPSPNQAYSPTSTGRRSSRQRTRTRTCTSSASSSHPCSRRAS